MLKKIKYSQKKSSRILSTFLEKRKSIQKSKTLAVNKIIQNVKKNGDKAVLTYEKKFSKIKTNSNKIFFSSKEVNKLSKKIDKKLKNSIDLAFNRIKKFHSKQKFSSFRFKDKYKNELSYKYSSIEKGVFRKNKRIRTILKFENVLNVLSKNIDQGKKDKFLDFLAIETNITPIFSIDEYL